MENRKFSVRLVFLGSLLASLGCVTAPHKSELQISLNWTPTEDLHGVSSEALSAFSGQKVVVTPFVDARKTPDVVGTNKEESVPRPIRTSGSAGLFVTTGLENILEENGVVLVKSGATRDLTGKVLQFGVKEEATYKADVILDVLLNDAHGKKLWRGTVIGKSTRFGHSMDPGNYRETLSDATVAAVHELMAVPGFQAAMKGTGE